MHVLFLLLWVRGSKILREGPLSLSPSLPSLSREEEERKIERGERGEKSRKYVVDDASCQTNCVHFISSLSAKMAICLVSCLVEALFGVSSHVWHCLGDDGSR